jgi:hypothetical protein
MSAVTSHKLYKQYQASVDADLRSIGQGQSTSRAAIVTNGKSSPVGACLVTDACTPDCFTGYKRESRDIIVVESTVDHLIED